MAQLKLTSQMDSRNQLLCLPDSELKDIVLETLQLFNFDPTICSLIQADIDRAAQASKKLRLVDAVECLSRTPALPCMPAVTVEDVRSMDSSRLVLGDGRPRSLDAEAVGVLHAILGHLGSLTSKDAWERIRDSRVVAAYFEGRGIPSRSTVHEAVNCISPETCNYILDAQLRQALAEGLDDFASVTADSFSVWGNTAWPTDSAMIHGLLRRAWHVATRLPKFDMSTFAPGWMVLWLDRLRDLDRKIAFACGKANSKRKIRRLYERVFARAEIVLAKLDSQFDRLLPAWADELARHAPRTRARLEQWLDRMINDIADAARVLAYAAARIREDKTTQMEDKVLSLSDGSVAYIKKGDRQPVIGYKPQVMRSRNGFVTAFELKQGNLSDASRLVPLVNQHVGRTGTVPVCVSVDDGYSSEKNWTELKLKGVAVVSMNGAKGRKVIPDSEWDSDAYKRARNDRSAVESLVFTLRFKFHLYVFSRRGVDNVEKEMYGKVIAHNLWRTALLRKRAAAQAQINLSAAA